MTAIDRIKDFITPFKQISIAPLVIFRIIFGALMLFATVRFMLYGWVQDLYISPKFFFTYYGFDWVHPLKGNWMFLPYILMIIGSIGIILGAFYRYSAALFFIAFSYVELLDKTHYLNHYYFISLVAFLMILVPANRYFSLDVYFRPQIASTKVSQWTIRIIQFQLACVYFFAGLAKMQPDWIVEAQPLKSWLQANRDMPIFGKLLAQDFSAYIFSWGGCLYDTFIVFFLVSYRWQKFAYLFVIMFHLVTWMLFPIGVFPWIMIFSTLIFFNPILHEKVLFKLTKHHFTPEMIPHALSPINRKASRIFLIAFISIQVLVPFRSVLYPGYIFWNEEGFRFSWRVMLIHKQGLATFYVKDRTTNQTIEINHTKYLTDRQIDQMSTQPDMILQYAHYLADIYQDTTFHFGDKTVHLKNPSVHAKVFVALNGRPSQLFISEKHDLTEFKYDLRHRTWVEPLKK